MQKVHKDQPDMTHTHNVVNPMMNLLLQDCWIQSISGTSKCEIGPLAFLALGIYDYHTANNTKKQTMLQEACCHCMPLAQALMAAL